ncbi:enoyl-CoA hydratase/isomerase family protein [Nocardia jejuensis]|uniref:enoyl-CoA hydratase/isomerase family protein n=1 Tax=Nocardia jejuensis TaxID=328049 RepID=UPI00082A133C|nr:enoyl-CoA hydratase/isomerase family protein [Nocardia jejuensis]
MLSDTDIGADTAGHDLITLEHRGPVSLVTLNRPEVRNALSQQMLHELLQALTAANERTDSHAIVLTGAGPAFCSGDDLDEAARTDAKTFDRSIELLQQATRLLLDSSKPSVAALNGAAIGGGLELTLACDLRVAAEHTTIACPEVTWGLTHTNGASVLLPALIGLGRAQEMMLTGRSHNATWALTSGLISEVLRQEQLLDRAIELASELAERANTVRLIRQLLRQTSSEMITRALERESHTAAHARRSHAAITGLRTFADRHERKGPQQ